MGKKHLPDIVMANISFNSLWVVEAVDVPLVNLIYHCFVYGF